MRDFSRQHAIVPLASLDSVAVIGCGAGGRQVAIQLAAVGASEIHLWDFDSVDQTNVTSQGYPISTIGRIKTGVLMDYIRGYDPNIYVYPHEKYRSDRLSQRVIFCCVDSMATRKRLIESNPDSIIVEGRMLGEIVESRLITPVTRQIWLDEWFPDDEAYPAPCGTKGTIYTASVVAGIMIAHYLRRVRTGEAPYLIAGDICTGVTPE